MGRFLQIVIIWNTFQGLLAFNNPSQQVPNSFVSGGTGRPCCEVATTGHCCLSWIDFCFDTGCGLIRVPWLAKNEGLLPAGVLSLVFHINRKLWFSFFVGSPSNYLLLCSPMFEKGYWPSCLVFLVNKENYRMALCVLPE